MSSLRFNPRQTPRALGRLTRTVPLASARFMSNHTTSTLGMTGGIGVGFLLPFFAFRSFQATVAVVRKQHIATETLKRSTICTSAPA
jgi:hypothetical protein